MKPTREKPEKAGFYYWKETEVDKWTVVEVEFRLGCKNVFFIGREIILSENGKRNRCGRKTTGKKTKHE